MLDVGRWLAAIAIVIFHCGVFLSYPPLNRALQPLSSGVDFFFVLSGFVIARAHWPDVGEPSKLGSYVRKRFLRIFPTYWAALALSLLVNQYYYFEPYSTTNILADIALFPLKTVNATYVTTAWTLYFEVFFYTLFALFILQSKKNTIAIFTIYSLFILIFRYQLTDEFPQSFIFNSKILYFFFGFGAALLIPLAGLEVSIAIFFFGFSCFCTSFFCNAGLPQLMLFGLGSAAVIAGAARFERRFPLRCKATDYLGNTTYSLYLVHYLAMTPLLSGGYLNKYAYMPIWSRFFALFVVSLAAGITFYHCCERPTVIAFTWLLDAIRRVRLGRGEFTASRG